ncbi:MAG: preprotein translocase subunit SecG [Alphaproteobacteria bacterium CG11_big_fil_rev_8_21_14_0_20_44_7]|nr:MAG: preprotein translocase subunit SecG [Alphaproteobacteria bacterium CG11_big_fil_rev_8_21_14_0_20_44_7]
METILLIIHLFIIVALVGIILVQRNSSDGLSGLGGGGSNPGSLVQVRGSGNFLTKTTGILAAAFMISSLTLAYVANKEREGGLLNEVEQISTQPQVEFEEPKLVEPIEPEVPIAE